MVILLLLALGAYEGYKKGLLMSIIGVFGFVLAIVLGIYFMEFVGNWLASETDQEALALPIIAFLLIFYSPQLFPSMSPVSLKVTLRSTGYFTQDFCEFSRVFLLISDNSHLIFWSSQVSCD